jgi:Ras-related protein Rab-1A
MNTSSEKTDYTFKILTIGESGVSKTCLLLRYTDNKFVKNYLTTIGIDFRAKVIGHLGKSIKLKVWDTAGQERFRNITQQYYKGADGIVLVYEVTDRESFEKVADWMTQINTYTVTEKIGIVLLGNKIDVNPREVKNEEGIEMANRYGIKHYETSALNNFNIDEAFKWLTEDIMNNRS